jgi:hypothetical protein
MSQRMLNELVRIYQTELPELHHRMESASTMMTLWPSCRDLFLLVTRLIALMIQEARESLPAGTIPNPPSREISPDMSMFDQPPQVPAIPNIPTSSVANVVMTRESTQVIPPGGIGPTVTLPPGSPVDLASMTGRPELPPTEPGVAQVVLPQGGVMAPEVAAAIRERQ